MRVLEKVFNLREFDLNDDVLMRVSDYFDEKSKDYNGFTLNEEEIRPLCNFVAQIESVDSASSSYVCTYGYEITNSKGEKSTYADTLWIDTALPASKIEKIIEECGVVEPSDISIVEDSVENGKGVIWLIAQEEENPQITELTDHVKNNQRIVLYWD